MKNLKMKVWVKTDYSTWVEEIENDFKERKLELYLKLKGVWSNEYGFKSKKKVGFSGHKEQFHL